MSKDKKTSDRKSSPAVTVKGKLDISRNGMGYVIVEGMDQDIVVRPNDMNHAFHGDTVRVQTNAGNGRGRRTEGRVTEVVERIRTTFIGNVQVNKNMAFFIAASEKPLPDFYIPAEKLNGAIDATIPKGLCSILHSTPLLTSSNSPEINCGKEQANSVNSILFSTSAIDSSSVLPFSS